MEYLAVTHDFRVISASLIIAIVSGFTGLTLTTDLSHKTFGQRKVAIALASIALGGGIWSMHFVAMLGMQMPSLFYYDAAITLASALTAILIVGAALILLHFAKRSSGVVTLAGSLVAVGVLSMHYMGMAGLQLCRAVYSPFGLSMAIISAFFLCISAFWIAYGKRSSRNILLGTLCFGLAVFVVHFVAISTTSFINEPSVKEFGPTLSNEMLALVVIFASFIIFGGFLWMSVTFLVPNIEISDKYITDSILGGPRKAYGETYALDESEPIHSVPKNFRIPCEKDGGTLFIDPTEIAIIRAEGHYTNVYTQTARYFCVWSITTAGKRLEDKGFIKTHRSYLLNPVHVTSFERSKDSGLCKFNSSDLPNVPVSRSKLKTVREALGI